MPARARPQTDLEKCIADRGEQSVASAAYALRLARLYREIGTDAETLDLYKRFLAPRLLDDARRDELLGAACPRDLAEHARGFAVVCINAGDYASAKGALTRALAETERTVGEGADLATVLYHLGTVQFVRKNFEGATSSLRRALHLAGDLFGPAHSFTEKALEAMLSALLNRMAKDSMRHASETTGAISALADEYQFFSKKCAAFIAHAGRRSPGNSEARLLRIQCKMGAGQFEAALKEAEVVERELSLAVSRLTAGSAELVLLAKVQLERERAETELRHHREAELKAEEAARREAEERRQLQAQRRREEKQRRRQLELEREEEERRAQEERGREEERRREEAVAAQLQLQAAEEAERQRREEEERQRLAIEEAQRRLREEEGRKERMRLEEEAQRLRLLQSQEEAA
eukprot:tig00001000_g6170.t1